MLFRKIYGGCTRLYWEMEDFENEAPRATFLFRGRTYRLEFDGKVDELICRNLKNANYAALDIAELYEAVPLVERATELLEKGQKVPLSLASGHTWEASGSGRNIHLRSGNGQTLTIFRSPNRGLRSLVLRTEGNGITHEIKALPDAHGKLRAVAGAVTVFQP